MPGPIGTPCDIPEVDSGTLVRTSSKPPGINIELTSEPNDSISVRLCKSQICHLTLERIKKVYGSLDDIKLKTVKNNIFGANGYVDPGSPKTIHVANTDDQTIEHELIHVRQFAEYFGNITDDERRERLRNMAKKMTQKEWGQWNFQLEKEAYELSTKSQYMKSSAERRLYLEKLKATAKRANLSPEEILKIEQESIDNYIRHVYEESWINNWKRLRGMGDFPDLAPPYIPK